MQSTQLFSSYFMDRIAEIDFEKFYTKQKRILLHGLMWLSFATLLFLSYKIAYHLTYFNSFIFTLRMAVVNMVVFYSFFYVALPIIFKGSVGMAILYIIIAFPVFVIIWLLVTYTFSIIYYSLGFEILSGELKGAIKGSASQTVLEAISVKRIISQAIIIISILSPFFFAKILFEISRLYNRTLNIQKQKTTLEIQNINIEKDFLKAQLNPHFLFNTLNNLYSLSLKKDDLAPEVILNLSDTMSYTLYESNTEKVALNKEVEFIKNYVQLEKMRHSGDKNIQFEFPSELECSGFYIAPLLTFTFIENAFKYGLKSKKDSFLVLDVKIKEGCFYFHLENDIDEVYKKADFGGIGLENSKKRLQLLYPDKHELQIQEEGNRFKVLLKLDLEN
ncbi:sensor histidine kinase [Pedobacter punctiformis]|uniref:Histidine kinase n=1 Tax=Pedobacter punctiformis TaxID=3004097 RepID=A0ABT4LDQ0_9SPHI|nr:histidine kinase [Pedobacter sp. HCMS5-2]MCZ4245852.1 histidine kinase [Pedobacter sp. HCMS5-2]